jgi:tetratricopeptide (TPR) repeat protein
MHFRLGFKKEEFLEIGVGKLKIESEIYKNVHVENKKISSSTVPIEEALLINTPKERRTIIMDVLNDEPKEYIEFLQRAGNNDDTEVVHYAVTAMVEISKENDYALQRFEKALSQNPEDISILTEYTDFLYSLFEKNLLQGQVEIMNRRLFSTLTEKKLTMIENLPDRCRLIENEIALGNFSKAGEIIEVASELYPDAEEYLFIKLRYYSALGLGDKVKETLEEIKSSKIYLSAKAKEELAFWQN